MKKHKKQPQKSEAILNSVAKYAHHFNKSIIFRDKTKYQRNAKHKHSSDSLSTACST